MNDNIFPSDFFFLRDCCPVGGNEGIDRAELCLDEEALEEDVMEAPDWPPDALDDGELRDWRFGLLGDKSMPNLLVLDIAPPKPPGEDGGVAILFELFPLLKKPFFDFSFFAIFPILFGDTDVSVTSNPS